MSIIYKTTDRIPVKISDITVFISPLTYAQKEEIQNAFMQNKVFEASRLAIKYAVKKLDGVSLSDGSSYTLELENGALTDGCVDDLLNMSQSQKLAMVCSTLVGSIPTQILDDRGNPVEGVEILHKDALGN